MSDSAEKHTEIWSTRLQRELLALTTDEPAEGTPLPSFVKLQSHQLNIEQGDCVVSFLIDIASKEEEGAETPAEIVVALDVSLQKKPQGGVDPVAVAYPFLKPVATLVSGSSRFPEGSTIADGDHMDIELDWTPSLHLTDAVVNIALKIKESISQGESFHPAPKPKSDNPVGDMVDRAKKLGNTFSKGIRGLASTKDDEKKGLRLPGRAARKKKEKPTTPAGQVSIGDEINMLEAPWVDCQGVYSCKAIRRPPFVDQAMATAAKSAPPKEASSAPPAAAAGDDGEIPEDLGKFMQAQAGGLTKAATAGIAGAGAMFRNFTQSARSVLEESFLMITDTHIIEMKSNKLNLSTGTVTFAIQIDMLAKLKFRRQESISLFFKPAPDDPLIYMCPDSGDCVHQIQSVLKRHGVKGKHTNAATHRAINQALHLVQEIQTKELALKHDPSVDRVNEIMDLYRQAAERFEVAGDVRHEEVVTHMRKFLALPLTTSILEGTYKKPEGDSPISTGGEGIILESTPHSLEDGEAEGETPAKPASVERSTSEDRAFEENFDNILKEAEADLANMKADEDDAALEAMVEEDTGLGSLEDDAIADFENMLREADNELAELMAS
eukprot:Nitzschia sp. Nitz4//scaffold46_size129759//20966//22879//NITZ4_003485-RA/size129759-augustus-gene-0.2-mRNA-1//1//CDS//3329552547//7671//frame0